MSLISPPRKLKGDRLITPAQQQTILNVCRANGWQGPINYDGEQEDWLW